MIYAHAEEGEFLQKTYSMTLSGQQYRKIQWINKSEFTFSNYLMDVKEVKRKQGLTVLYYKIDLKETDFLAGLVAHLKHKKTFLYSFAFSRHEIYKLSPHLVPGKYMHTPAVASIADTTLGNTSPPPKV